MKEGFVLKSGSQPDEQALEQINRFTRRTFSAQELYAFPVVLCDNEIDRDGERFTPAALQKLAELFVGRTGIFNHSMQAQNQTARIFACRVERDGSRTTAAGEPYERLVAQAYLPRTAANADFITELESGIKKEVSVGCSVAGVTCSICGADLRAGSCEHVRGKTYGGRVCCAVLDEPTDAYEWSFVAVPAQREAGVIKSCRQTDAVSAMKALREAPGGEVSLSSSQARGLAESVDELEKQAAWGRAYRDFLQKDFLRFGSLAHPGVPAQALARAAENMEAEDLKAWGAAFREQAEQTVPLTPQLAGAGRENRTDGNAPFKI